MKKVAVFSLALLAGIGLQAYMAQPYNASARAKQLPQESMMVEEMVQPAQAAHYTDWYNLKKITMDNDTDGKGEATDVAVFFLAKPGFFAKKVNLYGPFEVKSDDEVTVDVSKMGQVQFVEVRGIRGAAAGKVKRLPITKTMSLRKSPRGAKPRKHIKIDIDFVDKTGDLHLSKD